MEAELNREKAGALGLTGRKLEALLGECAAVASRLASTPSGAERRALLKTYRETRRQAEQQRWYMCVQREAMGLRRHDDVDRVYPPPPIIAD
jgi:hypothetical protein